MAKTKRINQENYSATHVMERAQERYGVMLTEKDYDKMDAALKKSISDGNPILGRDANTEIFRLTYLGVDYICVYNVKDSKLTTLLPPNTQITMHKKRK